MPHLPFLKVTSSILYHTLWYNYGKYQLNISTIRSPLACPSRSKLSSLLLGVHTERSAIWVRAERTMSLPRWQKLSLPGVTQHVRYMSNKSAINPPKFLHGYACLPEAKLFTLSLFRLFLDRVVKLIAFKGRIYWTKLMVSAVSSLVSSGFVTVNPYSNGKSLYNSWRNPNTIWLVIPFYPDEMVGTNPPENILKRNTRR